MGASFWQGEPAPEKRVDPFAFREAPPIDAGASDAARRAAAEHGSEQLLAAIRRHHPEQLLARPGRPGGAQ